MGLAGWSVSRRRHVRWSSSFKAVSAPRVRSWSDRSGSVSARASWRVPIMSPRIVSASVRAALASVGSRRAAMSSDGGKQFVGEGLSGGGGAAGDLVEQGGRRAAVGGLVAVLRGQVGADERFKSRPTGGLGVDVLALGAQLVGEDVRDEIFFRAEVARRRRRWSGRRRTSRRPRRCRRCRLA